MEGMCVKDCHLLLLQPNGKGDGRFVPTSANFHKGKMVNIGSQEQTIAFKQYVELIVLNPCNEFIDEYYWITKSDRDKFFKRNPIEVIQCRWFEEIGTMNRFLLDIEPEKIVSCGASGNTLWVYYKTFVEKGWEE